MAADYVLNVAKPEVALDGIEVRTHLEPQRNLLGSGLEKRLPVGSRDFVVVDTVLQHSANEMPDFLVLLDRLLNGRRR